MPATHRTAGGAAGLGRRPAPADDPAAARPGGLATAVAWAPVDRRRLAVVGLGRDPDATGTRRRGRSAQTSASAPAVDPTSSAWPEQLRRRRRRRLGALRRQRRVVRHRRASSADRRADRRPHSEDGVTSGRCRPGRCCDATGWRWSATPVEGPPSGASDPPSRSSVAASGVVRRVGRGPRSARLRLCLRHRPVLFVGVPAVRRFERVLSPACLVLVRLVGIASNRHEGHAVWQVHQLDPHCVPIARPPYRLHRSTDDTTVGGDGEQLVVRTDHHRADQSATPLRDLSGQHALAAPALHRILLDRRPFRDTRRRSRPVRPCRRGPPPSPAVRRRR